MTMPKLTVTNYPEMLRKLSAAMLFVMIGCLSVLRAQIPVFDDAFKHLDFIFPAVPVLGPITIPFASFLTAFVIACITESIKLHDKLSDLFKFRHEFDIRWILIPIALLAGATLSVTQMEKLRYARQPLMGQTFYKYASSTKPEIDPHTITQALTSWSWYWICVEATAVLIPTGAILAYVGKYSWSTAIALVVLVLLTLLRVFHFDCAKYANSQIEQILSDSDRRSAVVAAFNAL